MCCSSRGERISRHNFLRDKIWRAAVSAALGRDSGVSQTTRGHPDTLLDCRPGHRTGCHGHKSAPVCYSGPRSHSPWTVTRSHRGFRQEDEWSTGGVHETGDYLPAIGSQVPGWLAPGCDGPGQEVGRGRGSPNWPGPGGISTVSLAGFISVSNEGKCGIVCQSNP